MGLFDRILERWGLSPKRVVDPVFGPLIHMRGYWEGGGTFPPTGATVEWFVDAGDDGPCESQRAAFREIVERYPALEARLTAMLLEELEPLIDAPIERPREFLRLVSLSVPESPGPEMRWELSFEADLDAAPHLTIGMDGWEPTGMVEVST